MKKTDQPMYRQGDVLLVRVDKMPNEAKPVQEKIIAHGESSNHCHRVNEHVEVLEHSGQKFLQVNKDGKLEHLLVSNPEQWTGEHHPIELPEGIYKMIQQREYDPYEDHIRAVQD